MSLLVCCVWATGVSMHVMACLQLMGEAVEFDVKLAGGVNMDGAVANDVSILERTTSWSCRKLINNSLDDNCCGE